MDVFLLDLVGGEVYKEDKCKKTGEFRIEVKNMDNLITDAGQPWDDEMWKKFAVPIEIPEDLDYNQIEKLFKQLDAYSQRDNRTIILYFEDDNKNHCYHFNRQICEKPRKLLLKKNNTLMAEENMVVQNVGIKEYSEVGTICKKYIASKFKFTNIYGYRKSIFPTTTNDKSENQKDEFCGSNEFFLYIRHALDLKDAQQYDGIYYSALMFENVFGNPEFMNLEIQNYCFRRLDEEINPNPTKLEYTRFSRYPNELKTETFKDLKDTLSGLVTAIKSVNGLINEGKFVINTFKNADWDFHSLQKEANQKKINLKVFSLNFFHDKIKKITIREEKEAEISCIIACYYLPPSVVEQGKGSYTTEVACVLYVKQTDVKMQSQKQTQL